MALRESGEESLVEKLVEAFPGVMKQASPYITTAESGIYSIESWGIPFRSQTAFVIRTSVRVQEGGSFTYLSYKSPAEIVPVEGNGETGRTQ
ncbi:MAG: hypothetical protein D6713_07845 [Deltaproteobacteria bacterium]|nr:MAG: hypothetical protein D6713_07845 [Deltaproteobacteria bacterium]